ncbi:MULTISPECIES: peptidase M61 [Croceibacter]|uniref:M61 family metallopeptidase n=1 Tax=Croceibacter TaxID=216431 RepID=UPI000C579CBD|nr:MULTISPECIES: peptidase M61 [Croceibacter]MBG26561.1 peptidase M61 [Croceibacter sp.]|tara:strand:+ start:973 stop:2853 length:1881 start_codon:yes stop_codon:yes gene_type:complete
MKLLYTAAIAAFLLVGCGTPKAPLSATQKETPKVVLTSVDLINVTDDKVSVVVNPPTITEKEIKFSLPAIVPGTYSRDDYGKYIEAFKALDYSGNELQFTKVDDNTWSILNADKLDKVTYLVNDTFDIESEHDIFSPTGTNIASNNYVLNMNGFIGYFNTLKNLPYEVLIKHPETLYAGTSLNELEIPKTKDSLTAANANYYKVDRYADLIDSPVMYTEHEPVSFTVGETEVLINVFSPNGTYSAEDFKPVISTMVEAQKAYLGDLKTTNKYAILVYLSTVGAEDAQGFGALEHNTSTVVVMPEQYPKQLLDKAMVDIVAHEFFHVVTPLSIHSEEIHFFDFNTPKMSQHLWMYEGVTEYFAQHFQVYEGLVTPEEFYDVIVSKIDNAKRYTGDFSFTEMSKNVLEEPYKDAYANVYEKGALIGMCIDLIMREQSNGEKGLIDLMKTLTKRFGSTSPFSDDTFIETVAALSYPEVGNFLRDHVQNNGAINYTEYFYLVGLEFAETKTNTALLASQDVQYIRGNEAGEIVFVNGELNSTLQDLGVLGGDVLVSFNKKEYNLSTARGLIIATNGLAEGDTVTLTVKRDGETVTLSGKYSTPSYLANKLGESPYATEEQKALRAAWLNK